MSLSAGLSMWSLNSAGGVGLDGTWVWTRRGSGHGVGQPCHTPVLLQLTAHGFQVLLDDFPRMLSKKIHFSISDLKNTHFIRHRKTLF